MDDAVERMYAWKEKKKASKLKLSASKFLSQTRDTLEPALNSLSLIRDGRLERATKELKRRGRREELLFYSFYKPVVVNAIERQSELGEFAPAANRKLYEATGNN